MSDNKLDRFTKVEKLTDNPFLNMYALDAIKRNGDKFNYYFASRGQGEELKIYTHKDDPEGVVIMSVTKELPRRIVLVKQYRYPINDYIYEFPAGLVDKNEAISVCGVREFKEETGMELELYEGGDACFRRPFYTTVGLTDESVAPVYGYAVGAPDKGFMEDTEDIETILADRDEVRRILREEKVAMKCALLLSQFLCSDDEKPFEFLG